MKVKIVKETEPHVWHYGKVEQIFEVEEYNNHDYRVIGMYDKYTDTDPYFYISKKMCELIQDPVKIPFTFSQWDKDRTQKVWTRDGREVKDLTYLPSMRLYKVVGVVKNDVCNEYEMISFTEEGLYSAGEESKFDLFLEHHEREYWVNVYEGEAGIFLGRICKSEKEVNCTSCPGYKLIKTISFKA